MVPVGDMFNFSGELLARVSSAKGWNRYTTLELYRTEEGSFILHIVGGTPNSGEQDIHKYVSLDTAEEVKRFLQVDRRLRKYTKLALKLLTIAGAKDKALAEGVEYAGKARSQN